MSIHNNSIGRAWLLRLAAGGSAMLALTSAAPARGQCSVDPSTGQVICHRPIDRWQPASPQSASPQSAPRGSASAHCRIRVADGSTGSGTLVARNNGAGLVLTCAHLFADPARGIVVMFADGSRFAGRVVALDRGHDLAAVVIRRPEVEPIRVSDADPAGVLVACGYGPRGELRCVRGEVLGESVREGANYPTLKMRGPARPGDSGGGVFDARGELVGVVWGEGEGVTYVACGPPLRAMLDRVIPERRRGALGPAGAAPHVAYHAPPSTTTPAPTPSPSAVAAGCDCQTWRADFAARLEKLEAQAAASIEAAAETQPATTPPSATQPEPPADVAGQQPPAPGPLARAASAARSLATERLATALLGVGGPLAAALMAAGYVARRARTRRPADGIRNGAAQASLPPRPIAVDTPPPPQQTVTQTHYVPYENDSFAKAHQWASEQVARKYPGAADLLHTQDSLIQQFLKSQP